MAIKTLAAATALALSLAIPAWAETTETAVYENIGSWQVRVDHTLGDTNQCFMQGIWDSHIVFRAGLYPEPDTGYILIQNSQWASLQDGQSYPVEIGFNQGSRQTMTATGHKMSAGVGLLIRFSRANGFIADMAAAQSVQIMYRGQRLLNGNLPGSAAAALSMMRCNADFAGGRDPFRQTAPATPVVPRPRPVPADPFKAV